MRVELRESNLRDVRELTKIMRKNDQLEAIALGSSPNRALYQSFKHGLYRITALIDGDVAAMWGVAGSPLGIVGQPYLVTGTNVTKISAIRFTKIYKSEVSKMLRLFPVLENYVDASYTSAVRMLELAGFTVSKEFEYNNNYFRKFSIHVE